jgi:transcription termination factor Rho
MPTQIKKIGLRTGDQSDGDIRATKDGERYFAVTKINKVNFEEPEAVRHRVLPLKTTPRCSPPNALSWNGIRRRPRI